MLFKGGACIEGKWGAMAMPWAHPALALGHDRANRCSGKRGMGSTTCMLLTVGHKQRTSVRKAAQGSARQRTCVGKATQGSAQAAQGSAK